jgi:hypothetical protein
MTHSRYSNVLALHVGREGLSNNLADLEMGKISIFVLSFYYYQFYICKEF